jgi:signal transduction histidine kinase/ligand-binding sensor domain-containing protein/DNA-binding response OmpR family regulator
MIKLRIILFLLSCFFTLYSAENNNFFFDNISIEKGLSSQFVNAIAQDNDGFLWFGTGDGLNRYDGYTFKVFKHIPNDNSSISSSNVNCLLRTKDNTLWIGTEKGLNKYNPANQKFSIILPENDVLKELANQRIRSLFEDSHQNLWIGTQNGLYKYKSNIFELYAFKDLQKNAELNIIRCIHEDNTGILWIGTFDGLFKLNPVSKKYTHFKTRKIAPQELPNNLIISIYENKNNNDFLWVGTESGLCKFNKTNGNFETYQSEDKNTGLSNSTIKCIFPVSTDYLLLGTDYGLNYFNVNTKKATPFIHNKFDNLSIADNVIISIFKDSSGIVWIGTNNGITKLNTNRKKFDIYNFSIDQIENFVNDIATDSKNNTWFATSNGVFKKDITSGKISNFIFETKSSTSRPYKKILVDKFDNVWVGTNNGLFYLNKSTNSFKKTVNGENTFLLKYIFGITEDEFGNVWTNVNNGLCQIKPNLQANGTIKSYNYNIVRINNQISHNQNNEILCLKSDLNGNIWFGFSNEGLGKYNIVSKKITKYSFNPEDSNSINSNNIKNIFTDNAKNVYIITDRGLCRYIAKSNNFKEVLIPDYYRFTLQNGVADNDADLWLSTFQNLVRYNIKSGKTISYNLAHELNNKGLIPNSIFKSQDGMIYFGSYDKYVSFLPESIVSASKEFPLLITSVHVFDKEIVWERITKQSKEDKPETIELNYNQNFIKIYFSLLYFYLPKSNKYAYMLEGVDKEWINSFGNQNYATYSNLAPGDYTFKIKAANPDDFWNKEITKLRIHISPPWWKSWWAYLIYSLLFTILLFLVIRILLSRLQLSNELKREKIEREKTEEINSIKLRFFTNISHEFRTPLTLILGPIESLMDEIKEPKFQEQFLIMKSNAERLLRLINQIMDFRKIENKKMELYLTTGDIVSFVRSIYLMFKDHASKRNIEYIFETASSDCIMSFDNDKIEKVIYNLLSNAFKFTPDNGCISIVLDRKSKQGKEFVEISISDTGEGVSSEDQNHVFERFYQSKAKSIELTEGTGIGLTLCKEFIELHTGEISIRSKTGSGSTFIVLLPINESINEMIVTPEFEDEAENQSPTENARILIVEDNIEMRNYLRKNLEDLYEITEASNGKEGLESVQKTIPDVIISDLMMPVMDGLEMCNKIKSNMVTSHIPFIILTAKVNEESAFEGYSFGADDYITKPFSLKLLKVRIAKLIEKQQKLQQHFKLSILTEPKNVVSESSDDKFIRLTVKTIDENMDNFDLNIELLCKVLNITHQQVYRKIKALTGQTVSEFIRTVRMKKASQLLCNSDLNISEIMYSVGFSNRSYFSKCFSEEYGITPKEYREKNKDISV